MYEFINLFVLVYVFIYTGRDVSLQDIICDFTWTAPGVLALVTRERMLRLIDVAADEVCSMCADVCMYVCICL